MRLVEKESKDIFFVEIREPEQVKKNVLESLKDIVENLQRFEKFKEIRKAKLEAINRLGKILRDINRTLPSLKSSLPEAKIRAVKTNKQMPQQKTVARKKGSAEKIKEYKEQTDATEMKKPTTELQKLESELSEIESKLNSLR